MGYQENYVIDNDIQDTEEYTSERVVQPIRINKNTRFEESEAIAPVDMEADAMREIHDAAVAEGLVDDNDTPFGGEGTPTSEEVLNDFMSRDRPEAVEEKIEEYTDRKVEATKKVMATREILTGMTQRLITIEIPTVVYIEENGVVSPQLVDLEFKVRRLTESQVNHIFNRRMAGKTVDEMTPEELQEDNHFRSKFLEASVVTPKMTADEWYNETPAIMLGTVFNKVQDALSSIDNTDLFQ